MLAENINVLQCQSGQLSTYISDGIHFGVQGM